MDRYQSPLVWIDLEMTGLDLEKDTILEISTLVTDNDLNIIACGPSLVINHSQLVLDGMDAWNQEHHGKSGLIQEVLASTTSLNDAQELTYTFLKNYCKDQSSPLCGNSVWQDRLFLEKYMPQVTQLLNYRIIDVSSVKELVKRWYPKHPERHFVKPDNHRACEDIHQSVLELNHYRRYFFIAST